MSVQPLRHRHFTLAEVLIVMLIIGLVMVMIVPRIGRLPRRVAVARMQAELNAAFQDGGRRARASGRTVTLTINLETGKVVIAAAPATALTWPGPNTAAPNNDGATAEAAAPIDQPLTRQLDADIDWELDNVKINEHGEYTAEFIFFPDGEASGPVLQYHFRKETYRLMVDHLTGRCQLNKG